MAKSGFGLDSVLRVATSPLPRPVQFALGSRFRFYLSMVCIAAAMFFGVIHLGWTNGRPSVTVDRQQLQNLEQKGLSMVQNLQNGVLPGNQPGMQPLLPSGYASNNGQAATPYTPPYNYNRPATGYSTPPVASQPMVYPAQPNYNQPLTGTPLPYQAAPYQANPYQTPAYGQQPYASNYGTPLTAAPYASTQYGTPGYTNPSAAYPAATNQYPASAGYPYSGYQNYGQPARSSAPQYSAPGFR